MLKHCCITLLLVLCLAPAVYAAEEPTTEEVMTMFRLSGADQTMLAIARQILPMAISAAQHEKGDLPDGAAKKINQIFQQTLEQDLGQFFAQLAAVYKKHFTRAEIQEIIAALKTPAMQKQVQLLPVLQQEAQQVGAAWGQSLAEKATAILEKME